MRGLVVILSGPSGVGKDTLIDRWHAVDPRVERVVAATTRSPRDGEVDGVDYHFKTESEFVAMIGRGDFLEHKEVHGRRYGTPLADMNRRLEAGKITILKIDVQGALEAMAKLPDAVSIFILPPSREELRQRILARATDSPEAIEQRLVTAEAEMDLADRYAHRVVNRDVSRAVAELASIVNGKLAAG
ncbi:MAG: Guanylate kinase [Fimbriimonadaceae bacterium]|nr:Guanylate kinase [Fimbriimonadaceae bacterium]